MNNNLDIWAIQEDGSEIFTALDQINGGLSIIYDNCVCKMNIGSNIINSRLFPTVLYNEESDVLIMLMKDSPATKDDMVNYLKEKNLKFVEVTFMDVEKEETNDLDVPIIWFAREAYVLEDAIKDSVDRGIMDCTYYPILEGDLKLNYTNNDNAPENVDSRLFQGLLEFDDKLILLVNQKDNVDENGNSRNVTPEGVMEILKNYSIEPFVCMSKDINLKKNSQGPKL